MTSKEMRTTKLPKGHIFWDSAKLGNKPNWKIIKQPKNWGYANLKTDMETIDRMPFQSLEEVADFAQKSLAELNI